MVYLAGLSDHKIKNEEIVDHLVGLVEAKAAEIEKAREEEKRAAEEAAQPRALAGD